MLSTPEQRATYLSQCGSLGTAWLQAFPRHGEEIGAAAFRIGLCELLGCPIAGFAGMKCKCGAVLTDHSGAAHAHRCHRCVHKTARHDAFGRAFDKVLRIIRPGTWVLVGENGKAIPYVGFRISGAQLLSVGVKPDRLLTSMPGDAPSFTWALDFVVCDPTTTVNVHGAATVPLRAAGAAHRSKVLHYAGVLAENYKLLPVAVEVYGGLHKDVEAQLQQWTKEQCGLNVRRAAAVMGIVRKQLSLALLHARVDEVTAAKDNLAMWATPADADGDWGGEAARRAARGRDRVYDVTTSDSALQYYQGANRNAQRGWQRV